MQINKWPDYTTHKDIDLLQYFKLSWFALNKDAFLAWDDLSCSVSQVCSVVNIASSDYCYASVETFCIYRASKWTV